MDIRLKEMPFEFEGKKYMLRCNMNVLADVQEAYNGSIKAALGGATLKSTTTFLSAMLNDYADEQGWEERYTPRQVGRLVGADAHTIKTVIPEIMELVSSALAPAEKEGEIEKN